MILENCTKLKFIKLNNGKPDYSDYVEDFFLGGSLLFDEQKQAYLHPTKTDYILDDSCVKHVVRQNLGGKIVGIIQCIYDAESLKQNLECRCSIIRGELPYNTAMGIPLKS